MGRRSQGTLALVAALAAAAACAAISALIWATGPRQVPASAVCLVLLVLGWPLSFLAVRSSIGTRSALVPPLASLGLLPFVVLGALWAYDHPIVDAHPRCAVGDLALAVLVPPALLVGVGIAHGWAVVLVSGRRAVRFEALLGSLANVALGAGAAVVVLTLPGALRSADPDEWAARLPVWQEVPPAPAGADGLRIVHSWDSFAPMVRWGGPIEVSSSGQHPLELRRDTQRSLWVVTESVDGSVRPIAAVSDTGLDPLTLSASALRDRSRAIAVPRGWLAEACVGVGAAFAAVALGGWLSRRHRERSSGAEGRHLGGGWIAIADGMPLVHDPAAAALPAGPVVVRLGPATAATYRASGSPASISILARGTCADVDARARSLEAAGHAAALALVLLSCAPLLIAL
jgi:hypothetical protein